MHNSIRLIIDNWLNIQIYYCIMILINKNHSSRNRSIWPVSSKLKWNIEKKQRKCAKKIAPTTTTAVIIIIMLSNMRKSKSYWFYWIYGKWTNGWSSKTKYGGCDQQQQQQTKFVCECFIKIIIGTLVYYHHQPNDDDFSIDYIQHFNGTLN